MNPRLCVHCGNPYVPAANNHQKQQFCRECRAACVQRCHKAQFGKWRRLADPLRAALAPCQVNDAETVGKILGVSGQTVRNIERNALCKIAAAIQLYSKT